MAKKIIIMEKIPQQNFFTVNYIFWLDVPLAQQPLRANQSLMSAYPGATTQEIQDIKDGKILEHGGNTSYNMDATNIQIATDLQMRYVVEQNALNNSMKYNYYGTYWDGTSWTVQGV